MPAVKGRWTMWDVKWQRALWLATFCLAGLLGSLSLVAFALLLWDRENGYRALVLDAPALHAGDQTRCPDFRSVHSLAKSIAVNLSEVESATVGEPRNVLWRVAAAPQGLPPTYLIFAWPNAMRFEVRGVPNPLDRWFREEAGYIALPPEAIAPHGIRFGSGRTRILVPLNNRTATAGAYAAIHHEAGSERVDVAVVSASSCGEHLSTEVLRRAIERSPASPRILIGDPFARESGVESLLSPTGQHRLEVHEGRYVVVSTGTGELTIDRPGSEPSFSPTGRFVTARVTDRTEVIDLVSGQLVGLVPGFETAWAEGDTYLIDGAHYFGVVGLSQSLVSSGDTATPELRSIGSFGAGIRMHAGSHVTDLEIDHDSGIAIWRDRRRSVPGFERTGPLTAAFEIATGAQLCCEVSQEPDHLLDRRRGGPRPVQKGWVSTNGVTDGDASARTPRAETQQGMQPSSSGASRAAASNWKTTTFHSDPKGAVDWRVRSAATAIEGGQARLNRLLQELLRFGVTTIPPTPRQAFSRSVDGGRREAERKSLPSSAQPIPELPDIRVLRVDNLPWHLAKPDRNVQRPATVSDFGRTWRWQERADGDVTWLFLDNWVEGSGAFDQGRLALVHGPANAPGAASELEGSTCWPNFFKREIEPSLYGGRYLLFGSREKSCLVLYDLKEERSIARIEKLLRGAIMTELLVTDDLRNILQVNEDGTFHLYRIALEQAVLAGRYIDEEIIVSDVVGHYAASYEGAHFVHFKFPGLKELHSFEQFASVLHRPDIVKGIIDGSVNSLEPIHLAAPPTLSNFNVRADSRQVAVSVDIEAISRPRALRIYQDGRLSHIEQLQADQRRQRIALEFPRDPRATWVAAVAEDERGFRGRPSSVAMIPAPSASATLHLLAVGIDEYDEYLPLSGATHDARTFASAASQLAGRTGPHSRASAQILANRDATPKNVMEHLARMVEQVGPTDTLLLFFAGHGYRTGDGRFFMVVSRTVHNDIERTALDWAEVSETLSRAHGRVIVIIDACHAGQVGAQVATNNDDAVSFLARQKVPMLILAAAKGRQLSEERKDGPGGVFTQSLIALVAAERGMTDRNGDGIVDIGELYPILKTRVVEATEGRQTPWLVRHRLVGDFGVF